MDKLDSERRTHPRNECSGVIMFNVVSEELNSAYSSKGSRIKGIARAVNISERGMSLDMIDMLGLDGDLKGFSFRKFEGARIEFSKPGNGRIIKAEIRHVSDNCIGIKYL